MSVVVSRVVLLSLPVSSLLLTGAVHAAGVGQLNDTGQDSCYFGGAMGACSAFVTGDTASYPRQDGRFGRDASARTGTLSKVGGGEAGFDFSPFDMFGDPIGATDPNLPNTAPACVQDNFTGFMWEVKSADGSLRDKNWTFTWYDSNPAANGGDAGTADGGDNCTNTPRCDTEKYIADINASNFCGHSDWRLPTAQEMSTIIDFARVNPAIEPNFFPNTQPAAYWTADTVFGQPANAWVIYFDEGVVNLQGKASQNFVRLVRGTAYLD